jgi:hypothetical protein
LPSPQVRPHVTDFADPLGGSSASPSASTTTPRWPMPLWRWRSRCAAGKQAVAGVILHTDQGSEGGFNRSSQHPDEQGCDDGANSSMGVDEDRPPADALAGAAAAAA